MYSRHTFGSLLKQLLLGVILVQLLFSCRKEPQEVSPPAPPTVLTGSASGISTDKATVSGKIETVGSSQVTQYGHCWLIGSGTPTTTDAKTAKGIGDAGLLFTSELSGLSPNTTYSVRTYAINSAGTSYGTIISFKTDSPPVTIVKPVVETTEVTDITTTNAVGKGRIVANGGSDLTEYGICWIAGNGEPTISNSKKTTTNRDANGNFSGVIDNLTANTLYSVRAFATNASGTGYGQTKQITSASAVACTVTPTVSTTTASNITQTTAVVGGKIDNEGGGNCQVSEYGHIWTVSTNADPTVLTNGGKTTKTAAISSGGTFSSDITGLTAGTIYKVRAYAKNQTNIVVYGSIVNVTAAAATCTVNPTVSTAAASNITQTTAVVGGKIDNEGGGNCQVSEYGHIWTVSTNADPTVLTNGGKTTKTAAISSGGTFSSDITGLTAGTIYKVRAYAKNQTNIVVYGSIVNVTAAAVACTVNPTVSTAAASNITQTTAVVGGKIDNEGGGNCQVSEYGHIWTVSTNADPTVLTNGGKTTKTAAISSGGTFSSDITGLTAGTIYKVRAYAKNQTNIVVYGSIVNVTASQVRSIRITNNSSLPITRIDVIEGANTRQLSLSGGRIGLGANYTFPVSTAQVGLTINSTKDGCGVSQTATVSVASGQITNVSLTNPTVAQVMTGFKASGFSTFTSVNVRPGGLYTISYYFYTDGRFAWEDSNNARGNGTFTLLSWPANSTAITVHTNTSGDFVVPCPYRAFSSNGYSFEFER
ncbi:hypothetical protein [Runella aurantiaca]|uniref:Fibronectin type-III domain-containing protein n=1 Tax=Runella aurantiaca TaxID=2282308 RepID=A0A369I3R0_9BACT|nr:hypothetical protein [Runella aurantiaca]RDB03692.1 hypothetical protein DVG78_22550 [Runella aurantiaca]